MLWILPKIELKCCLINNNSDKRFEKGTESTKQKIFQFEKGWKGPSGYDLLVRSIYNHFRALCLTCSNSQRNTQKTGTINAKFKRWFYRDFARLTGGYWVRGQVIPSWSGEGTSWIIHPKIRTGVHPFSRSKGETGLKGSNRPIIIWFWTICIHKRKNIRIRRSITFLIELIHQVHYYPNCKIPNDANFRETCMGSEKKRKFSRFSTRNI